MLFRKFAVAVLIALFIFPSGCSLFRSKHKPAASQTGQVYSLPRSQSPKTAAKTETVEEFLNRPRVQ